MLELLAFLPFDLDPLNLFIFVFFTLGKGITTPFITLLVPILGFVKYVKRDIPIICFMAIEFITLLVIYLDLEFPLDCFVQPDIADLNVFVH